MAKKRKKGAKRKPQKMIRSMPDALLEGLAEVDRLTYRRRSTSAIPIDQRC